MTGQDWRSIALIFAVAGWLLVFVAGTCGSRWDDRTHDGVRDAALFCIAVAAVALVVWGWW